ncbi:CRISPR-associated helicase Cas3' [Flammeovirga sp. EKP202]|uniref:CRISPR-associated helicase Cas3' n=1 Tax=Flammeovirga sp. EKP202 TaxID=2770592 RepID=UPI00165F78BF|nr:CRISPR-associated helicase Cas3' [Flammeovirga sp. EKP202]MBD0402742.1 CRISPR-associated helicase Cas3' [Flammeovirga sp. EKP202]
MTKQLSMLALEKLIIDSYQKILGHPPYSYQLEVAKQLLMGNNVILCVDTGSGKTLASIMPFLIAMANPEFSFPRKIVYSLPLRTLANSIHNDIKKLCGKSFEVVLQTGEYAEDRHFERDIIFSTIDQTLSNFLSFPLALSKREANINAGAIIGSYLVFDEFHLLDTERSMATSLGMLKSMGNLTQTCIMTATLSENFREFIRTNLENYSIISLDDFPQDRAKIGSLIPSKNKKTLKVEKGECISAEKIRDKHPKKKRSIVICNRVETAQDLYMDLKALQSKCDDADFKNAKVICLHSRFYPEDRKAKEEQLKRLFGKDEEGNIYQDTNAILIATQVVEAGIDISCEVMHTEVSPVNSFLQRVGRCARYKNETGDIYVYDILDENEQLKIETDEEEDQKEINKINSKYLPYDKELCSRTLEELASYNNLDGDTPKQLIEEVMGKDEVEKQRKLESSLSNSTIAKNFGECWLDCNKNHYRQRIRDIQSVELVLIGDQEEEEVIQNPDTFQSVGLFKWSLVGWLKKITNGEGPLAFDSDIDWLAKELKEWDNFFDNDEGEQLSLSEIQNAKFYTDKIFLNKKYFGYSSEIGLNWTHSATFGKVARRAKEKETEKESFSFKKDSFEQHNKALLGAFYVEFLGKGEDKLDFIFTQMKEYLDDENLDKTSFIRLITFMFLLHDYGKLNNAWQTPMQTYQALKESIPLQDFNEVLGHTDFDPSSAQDWQLSKVERLNSRPPHAGIGALVAEELIGEQTSNPYLENMLPLAIARHHHPLSSSNTTFKISDSNYKAFQNLLDEFGFNLSPDRSGERDEFDFEDFEEIKEAVIYFFLVRILRICDQKATQDYEKYAPYAESLKKYLNDV